MESTAESNMESTAESRAESNRVIVEGLRALTRIIEFVNEGAQTEALPAAQSCRMASLHEA
jgi:hypothetical protein